MKSPNPDLIVALSRFPAGDWIGFDMVSRVSSDGFGQAEPGFRR
jgi:hypothetical protein